MEKRRSETDREGGIVVAYRDRVSCKIDIEEGRESRIQRVTNR